MFIKRVKKRSGHGFKKYEYLHLVESIRTEKGPRQRLVLNLGKLDLDPSEYDSFAKRIEEILTGQERLITLNDRLEKHANKAAREIFKKKAIELSNAGAEEYRMIDMHSLEAENPRSIGPEYIAHTIWKELELDQFFKGHGISKGILPLIKAVVIGRLVEPGSELHTKKWVETRSALYEMTGEPLRPSLNSYYRAGDKILELKDELERHLIYKERSMFSLSEKIVLYDLTNTYFEGELLGDPRARYGRSKDKRNDCKLITLGLIIDETGFVKASKVFEGNRAEGTTLKEMIAAMEGLTPDDVKPKTVVMDAGIASEENLAYLADQGYHYIVVNRGKTPFELDYSGMTMIREDAAAGVKIEAKRYLHGGEAYVLCRSEKKRLKEAGIRGRIEDLLLERLEYYRTGLSLPNRPKRYVKVMELIGRLKEKYPKAAKLYDITVKPEKEKSADDPSLLAVDLTWTKKGSTYNDMIGIEGSYILRTDRIDLSNEDIWGLYHMLTQIEYSFRSLKSSLGLRPNFHQLEGRVEAHLFISVLAYHLLHIIEYRLRAKGDRRSWPTIRDIMKNHERVTISFNVLDDNGEAKKHFIRLNTTLELDQLTIYRNLNLTPIPLSRKHLASKGVVTTKMDNS